MRIRSPLLTKLVGQLAGAVFRTISRTLRFHGLSETPGTDPTSLVAGSHIYALWHDAILIPLAKQAIFNTPVAALVSRHQDGAYLVEFMHCIGVRSVRGSTSRGGDQALRELMRVEAECQIYITPDGPRGPQHEIKQGLIYLASRTGRSIVPIATRFGNAWYVPGKWTGQYIPKPFSQNWYLLGTPISVPPDQSREQIEAWRDLVQSEMERLDLKLGRIISGEEPELPSLRKAA